MATYQEQIERNRRRREEYEKKKAEIADAAAPLTKEQIAHWRLVLAHMGIPYASVMPENMIQLFRDRINARLAQMNQDSEQEHPKRDREGK